MEVAVSKDKSGAFAIEMGPLTLSLEEHVVKALYNVVSRRLNEGDANEAAMLVKKLNAYKVLASKMQGVDDRVVQKFVAQLTPEQLVTLVKLGGGATLKQKILRNLSKQNGRQFESDFETFNRITEHQAIIYMEQIIPLIKKAAQEQKAIQNAG